MSCAATVTLSRSLPVRTFDRGIIFIDEVALDELDCEARLAHTSSTDNDELVFPQELM